MITSYRNNIYLNRSLTGLLKAIAILIFLSTPVLCQSLQSYQEEAARNNPLLRAAYSEYLASLEMSSQVSTLPDPEVGFAYFISPIETRLGSQRARISVTQMFPWFGSLQDRTTGTHYRSKAAFEQFQSQRNQLFYQMELLWAEMYQINEQIRLANENLEIVNTLVSISLRKYETGLVPQVDVLRAQIEQEDLKTNIQLLEDNQQLLVKRFNELRNLDLHTSVDMPTELPETSLEIQNEAQILQEIKNNNPDLNQLRSYEEAAENSVHVASNNGAPSFGVGFDYIFTGERDDVAGLTDNGRDAMVARLSVKIPLFRNKYNSETQEATLRMNASRERVIARENQLETSFYTSLRNLEDAHRRFELYDTRQIQRVEQAVNILLQSYSSDNTQFEEILRLQRKLFNYELERIKAQTDTYRAQSSIRYLSGEQNIDPREINY